MSFGFSIGDFIKVLQLANDIRKQFVGAPDQFKGISDEFIAPLYYSHLLTVSWDRVKSLERVLQDVDVELAGCELNDQQMDQLSKISHSCQGVLERLQKTLDKYGELDSSKGTLNRRVRRIWKRFKWDPADFCELRDRIKSNITLLDVFLGAMSW